MERMLAPLIALLFAASSAHAATQYRCDMALLNKILLAPPADAAGLLKADNPAHLNSHGRVRIPTASQPPTLCDQPVWDEVIRNYVDDWEWKPAVRSDVKMQAIYLKWTAEAFFKLDAQADAAMAAAKDLLAAGEKLGAVTQAAGAYTVVAVDDLAKLKMKLARDKQEAAVLDVVSKEAAPTFPSYMTQSLGDDWRVHAAAGRKTEKYYMELLKLREAIKVFADHPQAKDAEMKKRLRVEDGATPEAPGTTAKSWSAVGWMMITLAASDNSTAKGHSALDRADAQLSDRVADRHRQVQLMVKKLDDLIAKAYPQGGVAAFTAWIQKAAAQEKDAQVKKEQLKQQETDLSGKLEDYRKAFELKTKEEIAAGIDQKTDLTAEGKTELKTEYAGGKVETKVNAEGKTMFTYTVVGKDGKPKIVSETPAPTTLAQLTHPGNAEIDAKIVAGMILSGQDFQASLTALIAAITQPDPQLNEEPLTSPDGKTLTPIDQVKQGVPWWRKLIDPFHGKMDKYKKRQLHQLSKDAGESSKERRQRQNEYDAAADKAKLEYDAKLFNIENNPEPNEKARKAAKDQALAEYNAALKAAKDKSDQQLASNTVPQDQQDQKIQEVDNVIQAAFDQQIRAKVAKLQVDYKYDALKRTALAEETKFGVWKIDVERKTNVFTSFLTDAHIDGYFTADWAAGKDEASVAACRKALGFEKAEKPDAKAKFDYADPTYLRVDKRCVHDGLVAHINGLKGKSDTMPTYDPSATDAKPDIKDPEPKTKGPKLKLFKKKTQGLEPLDPTTKPK